MSLIMDVINKANDGNVAVSPIAAPAPVSSSSKKVYWIALVLLLLAGGSTFWFFSGNHIISLQIKEPVVEPAVPVKPEVVRETVLTKVRSNPNITLEGIVWDPEGSYCLIEGDVMKEGDSIAGYSIKKIQKDGILVLDNQNIESFIPLKQKRVS